MPPLAVALDPKVLTPRAGRYRLAGGGVIAVAAQDGGLALRALDAAGFAALAGAGHGFQNALEFQGRRHRREHVHRIGGARADGGQEGRHLLPRLGAHARQGQPCPVGSVARDDGVAPAGSDIADAGI